MCHDKDTDEEEAAGVEAAASGGSPGCRERTITIPAAYIPI